MGFNNEKVSCKRETKKTKKEKPIHRKSQSQVKGLTVVDILFALSIVIITHCDILSHIAILRRSIQVARRRSEAKRSG